MSSTPLGEREPRAVAYAAGAQFAFGAAECFAYAFAVFPARSQIHDAFVVSFACCLVGAMALLLFASRVPSRVTYCSAWVGTGTVLFVCDQVWTTDLGPAETVVDRLRQRTSSLTGVSIGIAERSAGEPLDVTIRLADSARYRAKRAGRDRLVR